MKKKFYQLFHPGRLTSVRIIIAFCFVIACASVRGQSVDGSFVSKFNRYQQGQAFSGIATQTWTDTAWKGDRLYKQIILWSSKKVTNLNYTISNLVYGSSVIPASNISLRFESYVIGDVSARSCDNPPAYPPTGNGRTKVYLADALSAVQVNTINTSDPVKIWVTIDVPGTTPAGNYTGTITVNAGSTIQKTFTINLLVTSAVLPPVANWSFHLDLWQFPFDLPDMIQWGTGTVVTPFSSQFFSIQKPFYKLLVDKGQKSITAYLYDGAFRPGQTMIKWIRNSNGTWTFDYSNFDKYVDSLTSWGFTGQINCFSLAGWNNTLGYYDASNPATPSPNSPLTFTIGSAAYDTMWASFLRQFRNHLNLKNWFNRAVLYMDENGEPVMSQVVPLIKADNANWKIGYAGRYLSATTESSLYDYAVAFNYFAGRNGTQASGSLTTFYTSCSGTIPNNYLTPQNNTAEMPWMAWYAVQKNLNGYLRWAYDYWTNLDPVNMQDGANTAGDFEMIYRTNNTTSAQPLSSIRLELLRDGIQDFEKIKILGRSATLLNNAINQFTDNSGGNAQTLVQNGQSVLKQMASLQTVLPVTYCSVGGGSYTGYFVQKVTSTGGSSNLNFSTTSYPAGGYIYHTATSLNIVKGGSCTINLTNSAASNCARSAVWVDWNADGDFTDQGEQVFNAGIVQSCANTTTYSFNITVPSTATIGSTRMRIQIKDAWLSAPASCGVNDYTGSADFTITVNPSGARIADQPLLDESQKSTLILSPNPAQNEIYIQTDNLTQIKSCSLFNSVGQLLNRFSFSTLSSRQKINTTNLVTGVYFLSVELTDNSRYVMKFTK